MNMISTNPMLDVYVYETQQLLEALENTQLKASGRRYSPRIRSTKCFVYMHTIKGASAMIGIENMAKLSHSLEDMFSQIRDLRRARAGVASHL
jgi:two-component system chemotaxis sensor kinase CheA